MKLSARCCENQIVVTISYLQQPMPWVVSIKSIGYPLLVSQGEMIKKSRHSNKRSPESHWEHKLVGTSRLSPSIEWMRCHRREVKSEASLGETKHNRQRGALCLAVMDSCCKLSCTYVLEIILDESLYSRCIIWKHSVSADLYAYKRNASIRHLPSKRISVSSLSIREIKNHYFACLEDTSYLRNIWEHEWIALRKCVYR